jgi:hypothetical protein
MAVNYPHPSRYYNAYIFDLDGTVYLGEALLPTAGETITYLRKLGKRTVFLSNNPTHTREEYAAKLTRLGLDTPESDVINSSYVMVNSQATCARRQIVRRRGKLAQQRAEPGRFRAGGECNPGRRGDRQLRPHLRLSQAADCV